MKLVNPSTLRQAAVVLTSAFLLATATPAIAQDYPPAVAQDYPPAASQDYPPPPSFSQPQLDNLVSRIALYPDPLLAQIFAAASFPDQIAEAARWANQYRNLHGDQLADAIYRSNLPFDPAVQALIPFPSVLEMMASDLNWTSALGNAVLADRLDVMESVQRMRRAAEQYGYLRSNDQMRVVNTGSAVEIVPVNPSLIYVPVYDPYVVYAAPRPGFFIGSAIGFGPCYSIGAFSGWGWGGGFNWYNHSVFLNRAVWGRTWYNRGVYVHNYGNWDRGAWRNGYSPRGFNMVNNRGSYRNENVYSNSRGYDRGAQGRYGQNAYSNYGGYNRGAAVAPNANYGRNAYANSGSYNRGAQPAPVAPSANYGRSYSNSGSYNRGAQPAPVAPSSNYGRSYSNSGGYNRGAQPAPVAPSANYGRSYSNSGSYSRPAQPAPAAPSNYGRGYSNSGNYNRGVQAAPSGNSGRSYSAPAPSQSRSFGGGGGGRGNEGGRSERGGRR